MSAPLLVFDMDGVLVEVTESYRETITRTVEHFTGALPTREQIQQYKNAGGWNDDWKLSHHMVCEAGVAAAFDDVRDHFQKLLHGSGNGTDGLMLREQWVARPGVLEKLNRQFGFALFTGRPKWEAELTLKRFAPGLVFDPIIGMDDVENRKPAPDGLLQILRQHRDVTYVGDTVDDARCARAAGVRFIGIATPSNSLYVDLVFLFQAEKAFAIVDDINYLDEVFAV
jgi:HAD superfamily phosphatase